VVDDQARHVSSETGARFFCSKNRVKHLRLTHRGHRTVAFQEATMAKSRLPYPQWPRSGLATLN
jgi:hypothetical protein